MQQTIARLAASRHAFVRSPAPYRCACSSSSELVGGTTDARQPGERDRRATAGSTLRAIPARAASSSPRRARCSRSPATRFRRRSDGDPAFVDGWDVKFTRLLVTVDKITLSENSRHRPGRSVADRQRSSREVDGPWAVDLAHGDPSYLAGKGGPGEQAVPIAALTNQNKNGGAAFATDGTRYAFGFDIVAADDGARRT